MPILDQLASELGLTPDELRAEMLGGGEPLEPNYLTVDAAGKVGANFTGDVHAQGLTLDVPPAPGNPTNATKIRWLRTTDGAMVADAFSTDPDNNTGRLFFDAYAPVGGNAQAQLSLQAGSGVGGSHLSGFLENAGGTTRVLSLMDESGVSDFLQLPTPANTRLAFGTGSVALVNANRGTGTITHGLGKTPTAVLVSGNDQGAGFIMAWTAGSITSTQFNFAVDTNQLVTLTLHFAWIALG